MTTQTVPRAASAESAHKPSFGLKELPNVALGFFGLRTEAELPFELRLREGPYSLRYYPAHSEIRNEDVGTRKEAANKSFGRLFSYIQGENWDDQKFAMTTPVIQRPHGAFRWSTSFYMKSDIDTLPLPKTSAVKLYAVNSETVAVLRFSGVLSEQRVAKRVTQLLDWMRSKGLSPVGEPQVAQFDQPFSIPFLRRNEIHVAIDR